MHKRCNPTDTIAIKIDNRQVKFIEQGRDNGYNNWFNEQYLESLDKIDGVKIRVVKSKLDKVTADSVFVTNYLEYYKDDKLENSKQLKNVFSRKIIAQVLISADSHEQKKK